MKERALIIEDNDELVESLILIVKSLGYEPERAADGQTGLEMALASQYAFVLLDLVLPELEGTDVCRRIREQNQSLPIIMLTSESEELKKVLLLELGADDYVTKPFSVDELKARIRAVLRRSSRQAQSPTTTPRLRYKDFEIDFEKRRVTISDELINLTSREYEIVAILAQSPGKPMSRDDLNRELYGYNVSGYDQSITAHVTRIRAKIEPNPESPTYILTVRGVGYRFADQSEDESN